METKTKKISCLNYCYYGEGLGGKLPLHPSPPPTSSAHELELEKHHMDRTCKHQDYITHIAISGASHYFF